MAKKLETKPMLDLRPVYELTAAVLEKQQQTLDAVRALSEKDRQPKRNLRPFECTQKEFDLLPGLVPRSVFCYWTGLSDGDLSQEVKDGLVAIYKPTKN